MLRRGGPRAGFLAILVIAPTVIGLIAAPQAFGRVITNTIDAVATVADHGRLLVITGPIECTAGERVYLRATVTQRPSGALAEGQTLLMCDGSVQQWKIHAAIQGRERFHNGAATAVASARTTVRGDSTDAHQWLVELTLVND